MKDIKEYRQTKATVAATVFSVVLALLSLMLEWYSCTRILYTTEGFPYEVESGFYVLGVSSESGIEFYHWQGSTVHVATVLGCVAIFFILWALFSILYISKMFDGESGFVLGWIVFALAVLPLVIYALFIDWAAEADLSSSVDSKLSVGAFVGGVAVALQAGAILARNIQVMGLMSSGTQETTD